MIHNKILILLLVLIMIAVENYVSAQPKYCRYRFEDEIKYGIVKGNEIFSLDAAPWKGGEQTGKTVELSRVKLLCPSEPRVILGLGKSYRQSWKGKTPPKTVRWFLKPPSSAGNPNDDVVLPASLDAVKVEVELIIVIGKEIKDAQPDEAREAIFGYSLGNDIVGDKSSYLKLSNEPPEAAGTLLGSGLKVGDGFEPFGPFIYSAIDWKGRNKTLRITDSNGKQKVNYFENTSDLLYSPEKIVSDLSKVLTLNPGDIISTGTGKSFLCNIGDKFTISIDGVGKFSGKIVKKN